MTLLKDSGGTAGESYATIQSRFNSSTAENYQRPRWSTTSGAMIWEDPDIVDLRDYDAIRNGVWQTTLGGTISNGSSQLTNSAQAFVQADVGATVVIKRDTGLRWTATINSVSAGGVATLSTTAPSASTNQRIAWGRDVTTSLNAAMQDYTGLNANPKILKLVGWHRATQVVVPPHVWLAGNGWGSYGPYNTSLGSGGWNGTLLHQLPGAQKDFVVFQEDNTDGSGQKWAGPVAITDLAVTGPETDTGTSVTLGSGVALKNAGGSNLICEDGFVLDNVHSAFFPEHGFYFPGGGLPLAVRRLRAFYNSGYGINFIDGNNSTTTQGVHFLDCTGDGNALGLLRIKNSTDNGSIVITNLKSEKGNIFTPPNSPATYQENAVIFEECDNVSAVINGLTHISSKADGAGAAGTEGPGPAILIRTATSKTPRLSFSGVTCRVLGTETANTANMKTLRDEGPTPDVDIAADVPSGMYPSMVAVVAAATITLLGPCPVYEVTGNTNITSITASYPGRVVKLIFRGTPTLTDGSNLKLSANLVATADDAIELVCDGTNWYETGRSVN